MRNYNRRSSRAKLSSETVKKAVKAHNVDRKTLAQVADEFGIPVRSLARYCKIERDRNAATAQVFNGYRAPRQIFSADQEFMLSEYLKKAADIYFGLSPKEVRKFAYEYAKVNGVNIPESWNDKGMAGPDWLTYFMKRHPSLSLRSSEATSLARIASFNKINESNFFFSLLKRVVDHLQLQAQDIWNVDEVGITTVQKPDRVVT